MSLFLKKLATDGMSITIEDRDEVIFNLQSTEAFTNPRADVALVKTLTGVKVFDNTNTETEATHKLCLVYRSDVGAEQWIKIGSSTKRVKILTAENKCEKSEKLVLMCTERGDEALNVNTA